MVNAAGQIDGPLSASPTDQPVAQRERQLVAVESLHFVGGDLGGDVDAVQLLGRAAVPSPPVLVPRNAAAIGSNAIGLLPLRLLLLLFLCCFCPPTLPGTPRGYKWF
jgi:hypothetical protein